MSTKRARIDSTHIYEHLNEHRDIICTAVKVLDDYLACPLRIESCNGDAPCSFTDAWCLTERSESVGILYKDLFDARMLTTFLDTGVLPDVGEKRKQETLMAFEMLAKFLDNCEDINNTLQKHIKMSLREVEWTGLFGTHIVKQLTSSKDMLIRDTGYEKLSVCICGCGEELVYGDTSMGNREVWHGSVDILVGRAAVQMASLSRAFEDPSTSAFELNTGNLEKHRHQFCAEAIVSACAQCGLAPIIAVSKTDFKVYMYDYDSDLLLETEEFDFEEDLEFHTILALWLAVNHSLFGLGIRPAYREAGYFANFKPFVLAKDKIDIYEKEMKLFGCKKVNTTLPPLRKFYTKKKRANIEILH